MSSHAYRGYDRRSVDEFKAEIHQLGGASADMRRELSKMHEKDDCNKFNLYTVEKRLQSLRAEMDHPPSLGVRFGVPFVDLSDKNGYKRVEWSRNAPKWRIAVLGMCLEGFCNNNRCDAYGKQVIIGIGMGKFDLVADPSPSTTPCPICKQYVEPTTCAFNNCKWRWQGKKHMPGQPPKELSEDWQRVNDAYHYFDQTIAGIASTSGICTWRALKIEAQE